MKTLNLRSLIKLVGDLFHWHRSWIPFLVTFSICLSYSEDYTEDRAGETIFPLNFLCVITRPPIILHDGAHRELCKIAQLWGGSQPKGKRFKGPRDATWSR